MHDAKGRSALWRWLGDDGCAFDDEGAVQVRTREGAVVAGIGDWIVLSVSGDFHVARQEGG